MDVRVGKHFSSSTSVETVLTDQIRNNAAAKARKSGPGQLNSSVLDKSSAGMNQLYKSLTVLADEIVSKLDELLAADLPEGVRSLKPENHTPEATAQRIVDGSTALFSVYALQNPDLEGEALIDGFMSTIRSGIKQGYEQAAGILGDLGAFEFDGVQSGIKETMRLVESKLVAFEQSYREKNALPPLPGAETTETPDEPPHAQPANSLAAIA